MVCERISVLLQACLGLCLFSSGIPDSPKRQYKKSDPGGEDCTEDPMTQDFRHVSGLLIYTRAAVFFLCVFAMDF